MRIARFVCCLVLGVLGCTASAFCQAQTPSLLIRGATIIDGLADAPLRDRSIVDRGKHRSATASRRRRHAGRRAGDRSRRKVHHSRIVRFPCPLGRVHGRALRQSRRDVRDGARTTCPRRCGPEKPGCASTFRGSSTPAAGSTFQTAPRPKPRCVRRSAIGCRPSPTWRGSRNTTTGSPATMRSRPKRPTRRASWSSAIPTTRPARCATAWTSSSTSGGSARR